jgi:type IV pilus assembly protein PilA
MVKRIRGERGFTLVELLVVLAVLAILIAIVVPNLAGITGGARRKAAETELDTVQAAMDSMMSNEEAVLVAPDGSDDIISVNETVMMTYIAGYDPDTGTDTYATKDVTWLLRTKTNGTYTWESNGRVWQVTYP